MCGIWSSIEKFKKSTICSSVDNNIEMSDISSFADPDMFSSGPGILYRSCKIVEMSGSKNMEHMMLKVQLSVLYWNK